jgi:DNA methylase
MTIRTHTDERKAQELKLVLSGHGVKKLTKDGTVQANPGEVIVGDARDKLKQLTTESVDCVITSPPYFRLRNYQHDAQIGLEAHVDSWVEELRGLMAEVKRVLKPTGSLWLNLGDSYSRSLGYGAPAKSLLLAPERLALALVADGWILRSKVIWAKTNPLPASVQDRLSCTYEVVYFLTKSSRYFFDLDAIRELPKKVKSQNKLAKVVAVPVDNFVPLASCAGEVPDLVGAAKMDNADSSWRGPLANNNSGLSSMKASGYRLTRLARTPVMFGDSQPATYGALITLPTRLRSLKSRSCPPAQNASAWPAVSRGFGSEPDDLDTWQCSENYKLSAHAVSGQPAASCLTRFLDQEQPQSQQRTLDADSSGSRSTRSSQRWPTDELMKLVNSGTCGREQIGEALLLRL